MTNSPRTSTLTFDGGGGGHSIVEQTTDIINRFRNSLIRNRKERLLDEDAQATDNIVNQLHFSELIAKETLGKLILQGDSMQRSYGLINKLQKEIKDIADDLHEVHGGKCCGACANGTLFGFACFGCLNRKKKKGKLNRKKRNRKKLYRHKLIKTNKTSRDFNFIEQNFDSFSRIRWSSATEREELITRTRALARERREHVDFIQIINQLNDIKRKESEENEKNLSKTRDYLLQHHSLAYGYIDQPEYLMNEIDMAINFTQLNTHLDNLLQMTEIMTGEVNKHNIVITKIEAQAMESGNLLTDYTLFGHNILGSSPTQIQTVTNTSTDTSNFGALGISTGQKVLMNSVL
ncbi:unnamed protein product [Rotaria magnacalcarata]|uniref:Uncharacterized protein n=5 Tax=Rotaria magnacalcarata TaxID=392030 RepID=A0A816KHU7_9BILA|nr:unnamed protein product [Rotaria magnacalcarata]CAF1685147.1 unnamed protein product [Rotaria magnacalcarata]CAF1920239.1 unnamed protein product [Rotaria magnacalcarata]CAF4945816.1 unnamed protein product [Rotaria magnacalcarata]